MKRLLTYVLIACAIAYVAGRLMFGSHTGDTAVQQPQAAPEAQAKPHKSSKHERQSEDTKQSFISDNIDQRHAYNDALNH